MGWENNSNYFQRYLLKILKFPLSEYYYEFTILTYVLEVKPLNSFFMTKVVVIKKLKLLIFSYVVKKMFK